MKQLLSLRGIKRRGQFTLLSWVLSTEGLLVQLVSLLLRLYREDIFLPYFLR